MTHAGALDIDIDAVRERYSAAIAAYRDTSLDLERQRLNVAASAFGAGFEREGQRITDALEALYETSKRFLAARGQNWEQVLLLSDATVAADQLSADYLGDVRGEAGGVMDA